MNECGANGGCKVFIGGLSWETDETKLRAYFENFGIVTEAFVSYDRQTNRPRGFGFVTFASAAAAERVCAQGHTIDRREVEAKPAVPRDEHIAVRVSNNNAGPVGRKFFIGGLPPSVGEPEFRQYFEQYGEVEDAVVMYDHDNKRPRGFGFITYALEEGAAQMKAAGSMQTLHDKPIEIKPAVPQEQMGPAPRGGLAAGRGRGGQFAPQGNGYYAAPAVRPQAYGAQQGAAPHPEAPAAHRYGAGLGSAGGGLGNAGLGQLGGLGAVGLGFGGHAGAAQGAVSQAAAGSGIYGGRGSLMDGSGALGGLGALGTHGSWNMDALQGALPPAQPPGGAGGLDSAYGAFGGVHALSGAPAQAPLGAVSGYGHAGLAALGGVDGSYGGSYGAGELGGNGALCGGINGNGGYSAADTQGVGPHSVSGYGGDHGGAFHAPENGGALPHELAPAHPHIPFTGGFSALSSAQGSGGFSGQGPAPGPGSFNGQGPAPGPGSFNGQGPAPGPQW